MTKYGKILLAIVVVDALATALGLHMEIIEEANPVMLAVLRASGIAGFLLLKILYSAAGIAVIEILYAKKYLQVSKFNIDYLYYKVAIALYLSLYLVSVLSLNL